MTYIHAISTAEISASPQKTLSALSDYSHVRAKILPPQYQNFVILEGGEGNGTVAQWTFHATKKRSREILAKVTASENQIIEKDENSTLTTTFTVTSATHHPEYSSVSMVTTWQGGAGFKGFLERTFAPRGMRNIQNQLLENLNNYLQKAE